MKLALHRSITFWSGLLAMVFIVWAWWESQYRVASVRQGAWLFVNAYSACEVNYVPAAARLPSMARVHPALTASWTEPFPLPLHIHGGGQRISANQLSDELRNSGLPRRARIIVTIRAEPTDRWLLFIPHWLILLAVVVPWLGLLLWRVRRRRKAASV